MLIANTHLVRRSRPVACRDVESVDVCGRKYGPSPLDSQVLARTITLSKSVVDVALVFGAFSHIQETTGGQKFQPPVMHKGVTTFHHDPPSPITGQRCAREASGYSNILFYLYNTWGHHYKHC
jgi:hypothetical protein